MQGTTVNGYRFVSLIGRGGMAEVWKAVEASLGVDVVAIKVLNANLANNEDFVKRFEAEARIMSRLKQNNIRDVRALTKLSDGRPCIIMEYLEGADLASRMKRGEKFTDEQLCKWWNQMVDALNYTHSQGVIHRDIKPSNIFITDSDDVKLLDFGIAKNTDVSLLTITGATMGTLMYMSPEQVRDSKHIDFRTDVYSLAVSFIHLVTGRIPYDANSSDDYAVRKGIVELPFNMTGVPSYWQAILSPYLAKEPSERQQLKKIAESDSQIEGTVIDVIEEKPRIEKEAITQKEKKSKKRWLLLLMIGLLAVIGTFCFWYFNSNLTLSQEEIHLSCDGDSKTIEVLSNRDWKFTNNNSHKFDVTNSGNTLVVSCPASMETENGVYYFDVETTNGAIIKKKVKVIIGPQSPLSVSNSDLLFGAKSEKKTLSVNSNVDWKVQKQNCSFVTLTKYDNKVIVECSENTTTTKRTCSFKVVTEDGTKSVEVMIEQVGKKTESAASGNANKVTNHSTSHNDYNTILKTYIIYFDSGVTTLRDASKNELNNIVKLLNTDLQNSIAKIEGHTDNAESLETSVKLSANRAKSVFDYLVGHGVAAKRLSYMGFAYQEPVALNNTEEGRQKNNRVEIKVYGNKAVEQNTSNHNSNLYRVQLFALPSNKPVELFNIPNLKVKELNGMYKYYLGDYDTYEEAEAALNKLSDEYRSSALILESKR